MTHPVTSTSDGTHTYDYCRYKGIPIWPSKAAKKLTDFYIFWIHIYQDASNSINNIETKFLFANFLFKCDAFNKNIRKYEVSQSMPSQMIL